MFCFRKFRREKIISFWGVVMIGVVFVILCGECVVEGRVFSGSEIWGIFCLGSVRSCFIFN